MWFNKAVQRNVALARSHGYHVMEPRTGVEVADLKSTYGVMPSLEEIIGTVAKLLKNKS
jgi:phosphopantothenoylcysteine synthetase/decarboxylase